MKKIKRTFLHKAICVPAILLGSALAVFAQQAPQSANDAPAPHPCAEKLRGNEKFCRISIPEEDLPMPPPGSFSKEEARLLKSLFSMSEAELRRLSDFIRHLEKLSPEKRKRMAADFERATSEMTPKERAEYMKAMRERFRKSQENLLARYFESLPPEQAETEQKKFLSLRKKEQRDYLFEVRRKLGYPAPPPRKKEGEPRDEPRPEHPEEHAAE